MAKEPRVMALDMASTVPRKLDGLARALAKHARPDAAAAGGNSGSGSGSDSKSSGRDNQEATADAMAQVLRYYPNALRFDPETLAEKLGALRGAGLSAGTVLAIVGGAPTVLKAAAGTLEQRVWALREAFPSLCVDGMLAGAPALLKNRIDPAARVRDTDRERERGESRIDGEVGRPSGCRRKKEEGHSLFVA